MTPFTSNPVSSSLTTHPPQNSHFRYTHLAPLLFLKRPIFCPIKHHWSYNSSMELAHIDARKKKQRIFSHLCFQKFQEKHTWSKKKEQKERRHTPISFCIPFTTKSHFKSSIMRSLTVYQEIELSKITYLHYHHAIQVPCTARNRISNFPLHWFDFSGQVLDGNC